MSVWYLPINLVLLNNVLLGVTTNQGLIKLWFVSLFTMIPACSLVLWGYNLTVANQNNGAAHC